MKYDIGILGVWYGQNYGSIATYYALHSILTSMGKSVLMIDKPGASVEDPELKQTKSRLFAEARYNISERYPLHELGALNDICDTFILGSDQLWNYGISKHTRYTSYFDFVNDGKKKLAFATSFGHGIDFAPPEKRLEIAPLMARFDGISLREDDGVRICREDYGINAVQVLDPVYLAEPQIYDTLMDSSNLDICEDEPYLLTYILDPTPSKREAILYLSEKLGLPKIINVLDGLPEKVEKNTKLLDLPECKSNLEIWDWLKYFKNASYVITDSFHGASFALIYQRNFIAICNKARGFSRLQSLSRVFDGSLHIIDSEDRIFKDEKLLAPLDYAKINQILQREKIRSLDWLKRHLEMPKKTKSQLIEDNIIGTVIPRNGGKTIGSNLDPILCMGCSACKDICPKDAIKLQPDQWGYYRSSIDYSKCIECGKCLSVCPAYALPSIENRESPDCYRFIHGDKDVLQASSSGGIFYALSSSVLDEGGSVVGASWKEDFSVEQVIVNDKEDLRKLHKSKYLQSYSGNYLRPVKELLEKGKTVFFVGTPCQVYGLRSYLGHQYDNLLAADFLCGNAPSALFFKKYIEENFHGNLTSYEFRHKSSAHRWDSIHVKIQMQNGDVVTRSGPRDDDYQRVYHTHTMCPVHCEKCRYQSFPRTGDITIGDFWGISKREPDLDTSRGVSIVLSNNEKGDMLLEKLRELKTGELVEVPLVWMGGNGYSRNGGKNWVSSNRDKFYDAILRMPFGQAVNYALKPNHGQYRPIYKDSNDLLQYDIKQFRFSFEKDIWECMQSGNEEYLFVKKPHEKPGHYATLPLNKCLEKGRSYTLHIKFRIRTTSPVLNLHIKDSGSRIFQVIDSVKLQGSNQGDKWIEKTIKFKPDTGFYDEFMIGAAQLTGEGNFISFGFIHIQENE